MPILSSCGSSIGATPIHRASQRSSCGAYRLRWQVEAGEEPDELFEKIREGEGGNDYGDREEFMPSWSAAALANEDITAIVGFIRSLPAAPDDDEDDDDHEDDD